MEKALTFEFIEINLVLLSLGGQKLRGQESGVDVCVFIPNLAGVKSIISSNFAPQKFTKLSNRGVRKR